MSLESLTCYDVFVSHDITYGEYHMPNSNRYYDERIDSVYRILDGKIDELRDTIGDKLDRQQEAIVELTKVLMNGVSHRTKENQENIKEIRDTVATKEELRQFLGERNESDKAHQDARRWKIRTYLSMGSLLLTFVGLLLSLTQGGG